MPVDVHGKTYWTVAERLNLANGEGYEPPKVVIKTETQVFQVGHITYVRVTAEFAGGQRHDGVAMVNLDATSPAERNAPLETAQTSALGRALAFAGYYGSPEGIAGAEEIALAQQRESRGQRNGSGAAPRPVRYADESGPYTRVGAAPLGPPPPTSSRMGGAGRATERQISYAERLLKEANQPPPDDLTQMSSQDISRLIDSLRQG